METKNLIDNNIFKYFDEISKIPHGSKNMDIIADYCVDFANKHSLKYYRDGADNVIIYKSASAGYEGAEPVILQGHLDMVCQKTDDCPIDFLNDPLNVFCEGDFLKARGTTLGADNGIAVAMILNLLASDNISHPPIEAVFTTDEEIGMLGAIALDVKKLSAKQMINLDSEEDDTLTVSCAGGSDFTAKIPLTRKLKNGTQLSVTIHSLKGGHSGVDINKQRANADILGFELLKFLNKDCEFSIISIDGGDKANAIPTAVSIKLCTKKPIALLEKAREWYEEKSVLLSDNEPDFSVRIKNLGNGEKLCIADDIKNKIIDFLNDVPNGVLKMSEDIDGLVETSLNLGILETNDSEMLLHFALRSNKDNELLALEQRMDSYFRQITDNISKFGHYPAWEYKEDSRLQAIYKECYKNQNGKSPKVEAIHAGLECAVFSSRIKGLDCISMGPNLFDVHTVNEKLSVSSAIKTYELLLDILGKLRY